ncbi:MAG: hypothetical protein EXR07_18105 [Acetobacteraceae bacterium]|nr:hypothetical protein [Acetobacteraceae bacterium]
MNSPAGGPGAPALNLAGSGGTTPFQRLASDIQAILIQAQSNAASPKAAVSGTAPGKLVSGGQAALGQIGNGGASSAKAPGGHQTGPANRHHHHHMKGGGAGSTSAGSVSTAAAAAGVATVGTGQAVSSVLAAGLVQAIRAYGGGSAGAATATTITA